MSSLSNKQKSRDFKKQSSGKKKVKKEKTLDSIPDWQQMSGMSKVHGRRRNKKAVESIENQKNKNLNDDISLQNSAEAIQHCNIEYGKRMFRTDLDPLIQEEEQVPLTPEQKAFFDSVMVKEGLHPAYIFGLHALPPSIMKVLKQKGANEAAINETVATGEKLLKLLVRSPLQGENDTELSQREEISNNHSNPESLTDSYSEHLFLNDAVRWPYIPRYSVPGFVLTGAQFAKSNNAKIPYNPKKNQSGIFSSLIKLATQQFMTWWI